MTTFKGTLASLCLLGSGWLSLAQSQPPIAGFTPAQSRIQRQWEEKLRQRPDATRLRRDHRILTEDPHVAGTPGGRRVAEFILKEFRDSGISAEFEKYDVLLSYPQTVELELTRPYQQELARPEEGYPEDKDSFDRRVHPPWHAYAAILPFDYGTYARDIRVYLEDLSRPPGSGLSFGALTRALNRFETAASRIQAPSESSLAAGDVPSVAREINRALLQAERDLTHREGIPGRPWFKHLVYVPLPSYQAETLPGIREALVEGDVERAQQQVEVLRKAIERAAETLEGAASRIGK